MPQFKSVDASQAYIQEFQNIRTKLYDYNVSIYFNQKCLWNNLIPNLAKIKIPKISPASKHAKYKACKLRLKEAQKVFM
jgi:hypothetical protein